ncbi:MULTISPECIES: alpha-hydroxy acid oxidase [Pacificibacter]|uniref:alpha-hydroxy acid oxidase n=1 Tax=Pacificibacter TaxID=1042323 RepID=UPI001C0990DB|nr:MULTISPECIES: alpha-hydroxy acid oxidase [Pacificibacter]MBU2937381.1 alpha-hydroxy-acid oxidizing protein [Pacificibacter marinus]MDO6617310.1 alpha-hydroxy acid oxidase [Pacificibacter sp. 1_MG-2023]
MMTKFLLPPEDRYPRIEDLAKQARRRIPEFAWAFLEHGSGHEQRLAKNLAAFQEIDLSPRYLSQAPQIDTTVDIHGTRYAYPFGVAPVGLGGLIWPGSDRAIAQAAAARNIPMVLSTVASLSIEDAAQLSCANLWFQLYPTVSREIRDDLLDRADAAGIRNLVITIDVPSPARRETARRAGLPAGGKISTASALQTAMHPRYALEVLRNGIPTFANLTRYAEKGSQSVASLVQSELAARFNPADIESLRTRWPHQITIKGILTPEDAAGALDLGADALWMSNHGGRQSDALPTPVDCLPEVRASVGDTVPIFLDSGVRSGLDLLRAMSRGADCVFLGRPFYYAVAAMGPKGAAHAVDILAKELSHSMNQHSMAYTR